MSGLKDNWKQKLWYERIIFIAGLLCSVAVLVLAVLQLCDVWNDAAYAYMPLMAITMLSQAYENRNRSKGVAVFSLGTAIFSLVSWVLVAFVLR
jgi:hypothetical protein